MFFKNKIVTRKLKREGFNVDHMWLDACSTQHDVLYVGIKLQDEPIPEIARLDLAAIVDKWATIGMFTPIKNDGVLVLLVVRMPDFVTAMPK